MASPAEKATSTATKYQQHGRLHAMLSSLLALAVIFSSMQLLRCGSILKATYRTNFEDKHADQTSLNSLQGLTVLFPNDNKSTIGLGPPLARATAASMTGEQKPRVVPFANVGDREMPLRWAARLSTFNDSRQDTNGDLFATTLAPEAFATNMSIAESSAKSNTPGNVTCVPNAAWQTQHYPNCNLLHELPLYVPLLFVPGYNQTTFQLLGNGATSDAWRIVANADPVVLKTMRYHRKVDEVNARKNRVEASIMGRLTSSPNIIDIYAYCANSGLFEFADGGNLLQEIERTEHTSLQKLEIALQAAGGIADIHTVDFANRSTIAHKDIKADQFVLVQGRYKLNDFNIASAIERNSTERSRNCPFYRSASGRNRSPEELGVRLPLTEKMDVYAFGNVLYTLLNRHMPFNSIDREEAANLMRNGTRPAMNQTILNDNDPIIRLLTNATMWCHTINPERRPAMQAVLVYLKSAFIEHPH